MQMKVEVIGGPMDGHTVEAQDDADYLALPISTGTMDGPLGLIPKFYVATLPIHTDEKKAYWNERY